MENRKPSSLQDILLSRADSTPDRLAYRFLKDGESESQCLTYQELCTKVMQLAARFKMSMKRGDRAVLLYSPGLDFIPAFFACGYAGVIPVPINPPVRRAGSAWSRIQGIISDSRPAAVLTNRKIRDEFSAHIVAWTTPDVHLECIVTDDVSQDSVYCPPVAGRREDIALLQYTSGSTGNPNGVVLTNENLLSNSQLISERFGHSPDSRGVIWLPPHHDMGLIGGILQPLFVGFPVTLMSPLAFLQRPIRWLAAITAFRATTSGGPNFCFDLCVDKISDADKAKLNLSSWDLAFCGSEPISANVLRRFSDAFEECGFRRKALYPCYGLAEATLYVSGPTKGDGAKVISVDADSLSRGKVSILNSASEQSASTSVVGCGKVGEDHGVLIIDAESGTPCPDRRVGEILLSGPSIAAGYWKNPEATRNSFITLTAGDDGNAAGNSARYFRTGDLGFVHESEIFPTGRLKEIIIVRGQKHYPQDIEDTVQHCNNALRRGRGAAFLVPSKTDNVGHVDNQLHALVIVQEVEPRLAKKVDQGTLFDSIRQAVVVSHGLSVHQILLVKSGTIPTTSSGKIQRVLCREHFLQGALQPQLIGASPATA